ncbi:signal peptidase I [Candidatus Bathyarchaeota archaeon]|nr:MAG: signal peptidase I [Candidatus Bathyarchaeota archaeon]
MSTRAHQQKKEGIKLTLDTVRKALKNEYIQTAITIVLIVVIVLGFWYGLQLVSNTQYPALAVASGSMCTVQHMYCDGWSHPFEPTLHVGDLIIIQGINPEEIYAAEEPYGDIIVFHRGSELVVHRAIAKREQGTITFQTKGDGNDKPDGNWVSEDKVVGKVVLRIPWLGSVALFMHNSSGISIIIILLVVLVIVEFAIPALLGEKSEVKQEEISEKSSIRH